MKTMVAASLAVLALLVFSLPATAEQVAPTAPAKPVVLKAGDTVPDISLKSFDTDKLVKLNDLFSKAPQNAIVFMNTACKSCQQEIALLSKIVEKDPAKLQVFAIAVDMRGAESVKSYKARFDYKVSYYLDPEFTLPPNFGFKYTPALVVVDKSGKIVGLKAGYMPGPDDDEVLALLK